MAGPIANSIVGLQQFQLATGHLAPKVNWANSLVFPK